MNCISVVEWKEIILLIIGAVIGIFSSAVTMLIQSLSEKIGKLSIYIKFTYFKGSSHKGWEVYDDGEGKMVMFIPACIEIENISKRARIMRDATLALYNGNKMILKMDQIIYAENTNVPDGNVEYFGEEKGTYSFVIQPQNITHESCAFICEVEESEVESKDFDTICLQYYDEKNKIKTYEIRKCDGWDEKQYGVDEEWIYLDKKIK